MMSKQTHENGGGILSSILVVKSGYPKSHVPFNQWRPEDAIIARAKSATAKSS